MKNLKQTTLAALLTLIAATSFTACIDTGSNEDYSIKPEDYPSYMAMVTGQYSGKMYFWNDTITNKGTSTKGAIDSTAIYLAALGAGDSLMRTSIPMPIMTRNIKKAELKKALDDQCPTFTFDVKYYLYQAKDNAIFFGCYPQKNTFSVNYGDQSHKVEFLFYNYGNVNGRYSNRSMFLNCYLVKITEDGKDIQTYNSVNSMSVDQNSVCQFIVSK